MAQNLTEKVSIFPSSKDEGLSPSSAHGPRQSRATSSASSEKSARSIHKEVENELSLGNLDEKLLKRTGTLECSSHLSRLDFLKGIFRPHKINRKAITSMKRYNVNKPGPETSRDSLWIRNVWVVSKVKGNDGLSEAKNAQCTFDTGNLQGNLVSKDLLTKFLGYTEADFLPLEASEKHGGISVTGHLLKPEKAVELTWYYGRSSKVFSNMRFLVFASSAVDLVIGARSLAAHNILSAPNLMFNGSTNLIRKSNDTKLAQLQINKERLETKIQHHVIKISETDDAKVIERHEALIRDREKEKKVALLQIDLHKAENDYDAERSSEEKPILIDKIKEKLKEAEAQLSKVKPESSKASGSAAPKTDPKSPGV